MTIRSSITCLLLATTLLTVSQAQDKPDRDRRKRDREEEGGKRDPSIRNPPIAANVDPSIQGLIPWPMSGDVLKAKYPVSPTARVVASSPELVPLSKILAEQIRKVGGRELPVATGKPQAGDILLRISPGMKFRDDPYIKLNKDLVGFEQRITANDKGVLIEGTDYQSTALATSTFIQSLEGEGGLLKFPSMRIEDKPASTYMGLMLDVARQFHPMDTLKEVVILCQLYKIPYFHLHFTDDQLYTLPSKVYPKISTPGSSYSEAEIRDFVAFADAHGVTIVPEVELPGHSLALQRAAPELFGAKNETTGQYDILGVINIANEEIYPALDKLITEYCELFKSSPYFHMGADETNFGEFYKHPTVQKQIEEMEKKKIASKDQLFSHFINRMNEIIKRNGKKTICWEGFGGDQKVDKDVIIFAWHGSHYAPQNFLANGYNIVNVPWTPSIYNTQKENYEWNKWSLNLSERPFDSRQFGMDRQIIGGSMVYWEKSASEAIPNLRTKTPARQERLYTPFAGKTFEDFEKRYNHTDRVLTKLLEDDN
jgi:hexosaminidase